MTAPARPRSLRTLYAALLVLLVLLIAAVIVWIADGSGGGDGEAEPAAARIVSPSELSEAAAQREGPLDWAGERPGAELELSEAGVVEAGEASRVYIRYLTGGAEAGNSKPDFLSVGTYRLPVAFALLKASAQRSGGKLRKAPGGAMAWVDPESPTSVYLAKPGGEYQVEVYDPDPKTALEVALSPQLQPVH